MHFEYEGYRGCRSFCGLDVVLENDGAALVICTEQWDNPGTSVTNRAEHIANRVCRENGLDPRRLIWVEHYPERGHPRRPRPATWSRVTFRFDAASNALVDPEWRYFEAEEVERLRAAVLRGSEGEG